MFGPPARQPDRFRDLVRRQRARTHSQPLDGVADRWQGTSVGVQTTTRGCLQATRFDIRLRRWRALAFAVSGPVLRCLVSSGLRRDHPLAGVMVGFSVALRSYRSEE